MEEQANSQRNKKKRKKRKKKKIRLMWDSGQSDADRRELRKKQRKLHKDIAFDVPVAAEATTGGGSGGNDDEEMDDEMEGGTEKLLSGKLLSWSEQNNIACGNKFILLVRRCWIRIMLV